VPNFRLFFAFCVAGALLASGAGAQDAASIMAAASDALGGAARVAAVNTFVATGQTRQVRGDNLVPIEFEIDVAQPDKFIRIDEIPAQETGPTKSAFTGQDLARLMLGMFARPLDAFPLTFAYGGAAQAPEGKADIIDVKGPADFAGRLFVDSNTHLPLMFSWLAAPGPTGRGAPPPAPVEHRLYYADYRDVDGLKLPFRLRHALGATTTEETTVDRYRINAKIDAKKFEARK